MSEIIKMGDVTPVVGDFPVIPFIEGDGIGADVWGASLRVINEAVKLAYGGKRKIQWQEVLAGEKAFATTGKWLPDETIATLRKCLVSIKGPLTTPIGEGIRSLNVAIRQALDLYVCLRPIKYFPGVPSPMKRPELVDMVIFRENTEDVYAGKELKEGSPEAKELLKFLHDRFGWDDIRSDSGIGIKPISKSGSQRLIRAAIIYALKHNRKQVTFVHKGNIQKYTEGGFRKWGYELVQEEFADCCWVEGVSTGSADGKIVVNDIIADAFLERSLTHPENFDIIATMNLNGDYISDSLVGQVGGVGIAPGANINFVTGHAVFEATHGTAPTLAGLDKVNPGSLILSGALMLNYLGWDKAANCIETALLKTIDDKTVTFDFAHLMVDACEVRCSEYADYIIKNM